MKTNDVFNLDMINYLESGQIFNIPQFDWNIIILEFYNKKEIWAYSWNDGSGQIIGDKEKMAGFLQSRKAIYKGLCHKFKVSK